MPVKPPQLDENNYDDLDGGVRSRIPEDRPEWTDHNDSDPGSTILQLLSWIRRFVRNIFSGTELSYTKKSSTNLKNKH